AYAAGTFVVALAAATFMHRSIADRCRVRAVLVRQTLDARLVQRAIRRRARAVVGRFTRWRRWGIGCRRALVVDANETRIAKALGFADADRVTVCWRGAANSGVLP